MSEENKTFIKKIEVTGLAGKGDVEIVWMPHQTDPSCGTLLIKRRHILVTEEETADD